MWAKKKCLVRWKFRTVVERHLNPASIGSSHHFFVFSRGLEQYSLDICTFYIVKTFQLKCLEFREMLESQKNSTRAPAEAQNGPICA